MTGIPHPSTAIAMAEEHRAALLAQAACDDLARSAQATARLRPRRAHLSMAAALAVALLAMGVATAADASRVPEASGEHLLSPSAARQVAASRW